MSIVSIKTQAILVEVKPLMCPLNIEYESGKVEEKMEQALRYVQAIIVCPSKKVRSTPKAWIVTGHLANLNERIDRLIDRSLLDVGREKLRLSHRLLLFAQLPSENSLSRSDNL